MNFSLINWLAVIVAGLSAFMVGGIWYSRPLFGNAWMVDSNLTEEQVKQGNKGKIFGFTLVFSLIMAVNLAMFLADAKTNASWGATAGFLAGFGWIALGIGIVALFERRPWSYIFINGGYMTVALVVMGLIIGAWR